MESESRHYNRWALLLTLVTIVTGVTAAVLAALPQPPKHLPSGWYVPIWIWSWENRAPLLVVLLIICAACLAATVWLAAWWYGIEPRLRAHREKKAAKARIDAERLLESERIESERKKLDARVDELERELAEVDRRRRGRERAERELMARERGKVRSRLIELWARAKTYQVLYGYAVPQHENDTPEVRLGTVLSGILSTMPSDRFGTFDALFDSDGPDAMIDYTWLTIWDLTMEEVHD